MRIIIDTTGQGSSEIPVSESTLPANILSLDGGNPSEGGSGAVTEALSTFAGGEGTDAGSPPDWLIEAVKTASQPQARTAGMDIDAGGPPGIGANKK
jgi:hypothetical protein